MHRLVVALGLVVCVGACGDPPSNAEDSSSTGDQEGLREDLEAPFVVVLGGWTSDTPRSLVVLERAAVPGVGEGVVLIEGSRLVVPRGNITGIVVADRMPGSPTLVEPGLGHGWPPRVDPPGEWANAAFDRLDALDVESVHWTVEGFERAVLITERDVHVLPQPLEVVSERVWWDGASLLVLESVTDASEDASAVTREGTARSRQPGARNLPVAQVTRPALVGEACFASEDCTGEEVCLLFPSGSSTYKQCAAECYGASYEGFWCTDDSSCCSDEHVCHEGHCVTPEEAEATQTSSDQGDGDAPSSSGGGCGSGSSGSSAGCGTPIMDGCNACADVPSDAADACSCRTRRPPLSTLLIWLFVGSVIRPRVRRVGPWRRRCHRRSNLAT